MTRITRTFFAGVRRVAVWQPAEVAIGIRRKGAPPGHGPEDVVSRLADCHAKIRAFLAEARALALGEGTAEARRASAQAVWRYFATGLPLHARDEDETIAPLLPASVRALTQRLAADHEAMDADIRVLAPEWARWAAGEPSAASPAHQRTVLRLSRMLEDHLVLEETSLFPLIDALRPEDARHVIAEMRARRGA
jgi:hypothetical protein